MKLHGLFCFSIFSISSLLSQEKAETKFTYDSSRYLQKVEKFQRTTIKKTYLKSDTLLLEEFDNSTGNLIMRVKQLRSEPHRSDVGLEEHWYTNGQKWKELIKGKGSESKYLNFWLINGTQTLKSGSGYYYETSFGNRMSHDSIGLAECSDSCIYRIKDSVRQGDYTRWQKDGNGNKYFLAETGMYSNNKTTGIFKVLYKGGKTNGEWQEKDGVKDGYEKYYYENGKLKWQGQNQAGDMTGMWKFYNEKGYIEEISFHSKNALRGRYTEYYGNGKEKIIGSYYQIEGSREKQVLDTQQRENLVTGKIEKIVVPVERKSVKDGRWKYYNETGRLDLIEIYDKGNLVKVRRKMRRHV